MISNKDSRKKTHDIGGLVSESHWSINPGNDISRPPSTIIYSVRKDKNLYLSLIYFLLDYYKS